MKVENDNVSHLANIMMANLMTCTGDELKYFIIVKTYEMLKSRLLKMANQMMH